MSAAENTRMVREYLAAISGAPKTPELVSKFVDDKELKDHIAMFEVAFPKYELTGEDVVSERDEVAVRATFSGKHLGMFQGIPATGREVSIPVMLFYQVGGGRIARSWMNADSLGLLGQLGVLPQPHPAAAH